MNKKKIRIKFGAFRFSYNLEHLNNIRMCPICSGAAEGKTIIRKLGLYFAVFGLFMGVLGFGESVMAQSGNLTVYANASATNIAVGDTVQFNVEVSGGIAPYIYEWDFDDVESYKNPQTISNPSHTFNWAGKYYVEVTVTDSALEIEKTLLIVEVETSASPPVVDAVADCGCDNSGVADCGANLASCITNHISVSGELRIEFPSGTYRLDDKECGINNSCAIDITGSIGENLRKVSFIGLGSARPTLIFYDDSDLSRHHAFFSVRSVPSLPTYDTHVLVSNLKLEMEQDPDNYLHDPEFFYGIDVYNRREYIIIEDCDIRNFGYVGNYARTIHKRNNIINCGDFNNDLGAIEMIRYAQDGLSVRNYVPLGNDDHSHMWYCSGAVNFYIIDNYVDLSNGNGNANGAQLKSACHDSAMSGNIIKNGKQFGAYLGAYDAQAYNFAFSNNKIINIEESGFHVWSSSSNIIVEDNFFASLRNVFGAGDGSKCESGLDVVDINSPKIMLQDSGAPGSGYVFNVCRYDSCVPPRTCDVTLSGNIDNEDLYLSTDPSGWYDAGGYVDPGEFEFTPPTTNSFQINNGAGSTTSTMVNLNIDISDSGSGMGSSARFPFTQGGLMMFSNDNVNWYQVEDYATTCTWTLTEGDETKTVYAKFRDRDGNWGDVVSDSILLDSVSTTYSISNFINLVTDWLKSESGLESDVNGDGVVNTRDLGIMMSNWGE